jgi:hypothetical protein
MSMTTTTARQPRGIPAGGQFAATTHTEPGIVLAGGRADFVSEKHLYERELAALNVSDLDLHERYPTTRSEAKRLLKNSRGEVDGMVRAVHLDYTNAPETEPGERVEIVGPKDGRPIIVDVTSGIPFLKVTSGTAIVRMRSGWGNSLDVGAGAKAIIIAEASSKVTTEVDAGGEVTFVCPTEKNWFRPHGEGAVFLATGTDTDRIPYERPVY